MATVLVTTCKGQLTLKRDLLQHLGIRPGERITLEKLPHGELRIRAAPKTGQINNFVGLLAGQTDKVVTLEEMQDAIEAGWAGDK